MSKTFVPDIKLAGIWGTWNLKRAGDQVTLDLFIRDGSPRDPWLAIIPLSEISGHAAETLANLAKVLPRKP